MKRFTKTIVLTLTSLCMALCFLFSGCAMKYAGTYKFESLTYTTGGFEKKQAVGDDGYTEDYMVLKLSLNNEFTMTEETNGQKTIKEGSWEEVEDGTIKLVYTKDNSEQTVTIADGKAVISYTINVPLLGETGAKITLVK